MTARQKEPALYISMPHACSYLPGRTATTLFANPQQRLDPSLLAHLTRHGFRRSGDFVYRPHCRGCSACVPVRVPVQAFVPNRSQRRTWRRNQDLSVRCCNATFSQEQFDLYLRYQFKRHAGGGMDERDPRRYIQFLVTRHVQTHFYELRLGKRLLAVAVTDVLPDALSAVYTFYDPEESRRALGVFALLYQIKRARELKRPWLYLGYWIEESQKMSYKRNFHPLEIYRDGGWSLLEG